MDIGINKLTESERFRQFGKFSLDPQNSILWREGVPVSLPLKALGILCILTERSGDLVTKNEIMNTVWKDTIVEESNLTNNISHLRKVFKSFGEENFIETIPSRGYRFVGEVASVYERDEIILERHTISQTMVEEFPDSGQRALGLLPGIRKRAKLRTVGIALGGLIVMATGIFAFWNWNSTERKNGNPEIRSIAVLPLKSFDQTSPDKSLGLRIMDSLTTKLGRIESISVRPTSSTMKFLDSNENTIEIGRRLLVDSILEGFVQREGDRIRVTLQLVSIPNGEQIWSEQFDGEADKLLSLQNVISVNVLERLNLRLSSQQQMEFAKRPTSNPEAYEEYLIGRFFWNKRSPESLRSAISAFERSIKLDPTFADAYAGLADSYYLLYDYNYDSSKGFVEIAKTNIDKAVQLNPGSSEAYTTLGLIQTTYDRDWKAAEGSFLKAKELAPNSPNVHHRYGMLLTKVRRFSEAETELRRAKELDPTSTSINMNLGFVLMHSKKNAEAIVQLKNTLALDPAFSSPKWYLARAYWNSGDTAAALEEYVAVIGLMGDKALAEGIESDLRSFGETTALKRWAKEWERRAGEDRVDDHSLAILYSHLRDRDETLNWLERSVAANHPWATLINAEPEFDFVRDDPRFLSLLKKLNLEK